MKSTYLTLLFLLFTCISFAQVSALDDDFEGNGNITTWFGDDCTINIGYPNPQQSGLNTSSTVCRYHDVGGQYANIRFDAAGNLDMANTYNFSLKIFVPSSTISGNQNNQVSLKLQNGSSSMPWSTQSEIIKPIALNQWQEITFDFLNDNYINLDGNSPAPTQRTDFSRVVIQVNGENNNDNVLAYIDDFAYGSTAVVGPPPPTFSHLIWSDEFNTDGPVNSTKWHHQTVLPTAGGWFNGEIQHYTNRIDNSYVSNGTLKIKAKKEVFNDQGVTLQYTSARLNSKIAFQYGKVEVRAKLPSGVGTWPAIWTLGKNVIETGAYWNTQGYSTAPWPQCGEIDIMEHWGTNQNFVQSATHTPSSFGGTVNHGGQTISTASTQFHVYSLEWTANELTFKVDGNTHYVYDPAVYNANTWPFDAEQFLLLNFAMLPSVNPAFLESEMEIDYVRVYQEDANGINSGTLNTPVVGNGTPYPMLTIDSGDLHIKNSAFGTILTSPSGNCFRVTVDDNGNLTTTAVTCPQ